MLQFKKIFLVLIVIIIFGYGIKNISAQTTQISQSSLYIPLIGITSVPDPLVLPKGAGDVTYHYAVKNFLEELPLLSINITDDACSNVEFITGDDNGNSKLDYSETWRYICTTKLSKTTQSIATASGVINGITATHKAYTTVVVDSINPPPLVSIVNVTKIAYPLSLPAEGGEIVFTYKVNNPGVVPLSDVIVTDDKCSAMSGKLGDTNGNNLLDIDEVWIYTCKMILKQTTTNTVTVTAFANGFKAISDNTITVVVNGPNLPDMGSIYSFNPNLKTIIWAALLVVLATLLTFFLIKISKKQ